MNRTTQWIVTVAAAAATFALGWGLGGNRGASPKESTMTEIETSTAATTTDPASPMSQFALLLLEDERYEAPTDPATMEARVQEYGDWARATAMTGRFVDGAKLSDDGRLLRKSGAGHDVVEGLTRGQHGVLAGYFLIGAASYEEAVRIAEGCPHVKYGGTVELRRIET